MKNYYFTFGGGHELGDFFVEIVTGENPQLDSHDLISKGLKPAEENIAFAFSRMIMIRMFGNRWSFQYEEHPSKNPALRNLECLVVVRRDRSGEMRAFRDG